MEDVASELQFTSILAAEQAILFIDFEWSGQARLSRAILEEWERTWRVWNPGEPKVPIWRLIPDQQAWTAAWLVDGGKDLAGGGHGAVLWLRNGQVVANEPAAYAAGIRELARTTRDVLLSR